jgi:hydroxyacylglutathione hydrolase
MKIFPVLAFRDNYIWTHIDDKRKTAFCVDPGDAQPLITFLNSQSIELEAILLTHHHNDHIGGIKKLRELYPNLRIYGPKDSRIPYLTHYLSPDKKLAVANYHFNIIHTPGHTTTHICLHEPEMGWLFCGDTLFSAGCGRVFDGTLEELHASLQNLKTLPESTQVFCGHEYTRFNLRFAMQVEPNNSSILHYINELNQHNHCSLPSTIGLEKQINPFFRTQEESVIRYIGFKGTATRDSLSVFRQLRAEKDIFN